MSIEWIVLILSALVAALSGVLDVLDDADIPVIQ